ncbi:MAG: hypothetical protein JW712_11435 [Dehalococcoidales bacterium]|nr:hypothetical protein [Dehalococcoidales bacterium]
MKGKILFCESYGSIPYVLQLIQQNYPEFPVSVVLPEHEDLCRFFQALNESVFNNYLELIYFESVHLTRTTNRMLKILSLPFDIVRERRYLRKLWKDYFSGKQGYNVYFLSRAYSGVKYFVLKKLSKFNRLIYLQNVKHPLMYQHIPFTLNDHCKLIAYKLMYGTGIRLGGYSGKDSTPWISDKFMSEKVAEFLDKEKSDQLIDGFDFNPYKVFASGDYRVIFFDSPLVEVGYITDETKYKEELASIFDIIYRYYPEESVAVKYHPGYRGETDIVRVNNILPAYIPAEFLNTDKTEIQIAISSLSLSHIKDTRNISVANLITFNTTDIRKSLIEHLIDYGNNEILFPETLDELDRMFREKLG